MLLYFHLIQKTNIMYIGLFQKYRQKNEKKITVLIVENTIIII